jgi:heavy metal efflux system protein
MEGGSRSDLAIKLYGDDLDVLREKADRIAAVVSKIRGATDVRAERVEGLPYLRVRLRRDALARHGLDASDVLDTVEAIGGKPAGEVVEGNRRFTLQVRFPQSQRASAADVSNLRVGDKEGHLIPLAQLADVDEEDGPAQISRESGQRRISVEVNIRRRDLAGIVAEAQKKVSDTVQIPTGYQLGWGGQFEQLESASQRLMIVVPVALTLIFVLLYINFQAVMPALLIFLNIPLAAACLQHLGWSRLHCTLRYRCPKWNRSRDPHQRTAWRRTRSGNSSRTRCSCSATCRPDNGARRQSRLHPNGGLSWCRS